MRRLTTEQVRANRFMETTITGCVSPVPAVLGQIGPFADGERKSIVQQLQTIFPRATEDAIEQVVFGRRERLAEDVANQKVFNWLEKAFNSRGGLGPYRITDVEHGNAKFGLRASGLDYTEIEATLLKMEKKGLVKVEKIPAGAIDRFWIENTT